MLLAIIRFEKKIKKKDKKKKVEIYFWSLYLGGAFNLVFVI